MTKRSPRMPGADKGKKGRPWTKQKAMPSQTVVRDLLKRAVEDHADAAALVQAARECQEAARPLPPWIVVALESWLTDFVDLAKGHRKGRWSMWARQWRRRYLDSAIADRLIGLRQSYGLTWKEAYDEATDFFRGTPAAGSPGAMSAAYKRDKRRGVIRRDTLWEERATGPWRLSMRPWRPNSWWARNHDRMGDERGEWNERPRP